MTNEERIYEIGDQVQLLSGGPVMTVTEEGDDADDIVECCWFSGKKLETGSFPPRALKPAEIENENGK